MRKSFIDAPCKILLYLAKWLQRRFLEIDQPETKIAYDDDVCLMKKAIFIENLP
jgi:hypothetical protein